MDWVSLFAMPWCLLDIAEPRCSPYLFSSEHIHALRQLGCGVQSSFSLSFRILYKIFSLLLRQMQP